MLWSGAAQGEESWTRTETASGVNIRDAAARATDVSD